MFDAYSDGELISMARKCPRDTVVRAELWNRADMDAKRGDTQLAADLQRYAIARPAWREKPVENSLSTNYRNRFES